MCLSRRPCLSSTPSLTPSDPPLGASDWCVPWSPPLQPAPPAAPTPSPFGSVGSLFPVSAVGARVQRSGTGSNSVICTEELQTRSPVSFGVFRAAPGQAPGQAGSWVL